MSRFPSLQLDVDDDAVASESQILRSLKSWLGSAAIHLALLLLLILWTIPIVEHGTLDITAFLGDSATEEFDDITFSLDEPDYDSEAIEAAPMSMESLATDKSIPEPLLEDVFSEPVVTEELSSIERTASSSQSADIPSATNGKGSVADATSVEAAVDRITGGIRGALGEGDVMVVWLLDASLSLKDDRRRVAGRLKDFLTDLSNENNEHKLQNAVVSFGRKISERVSPTTSTGRVLKAIEDAPADKTGVEKVFTAVGQCVKKYRRQWKKKLMIVVWTDESGDDVKLLDQTIRQCAYAKVSVSVVGPSSVLGADTGLHSYVDPQGQFHLLPVQRGPDSAMRERLNLRYWHPISRRTLPRGRVGSWIGGPYLEGIASGFSPYALTRLSIATGGSYTIFDRPEDRAPFDLERLKAYAPEYKNLSDYKAELSSHPLRMAVHKVVALTSKSKLKPPPMALFGAEGSNRHPVFPYLSPSQFASKYRASQSRLDGLARRYGEKVEQALALVSAGGEVRNGGMISEYSQEESLRWRAWYDLTRGRLLACSVRATEYRQTIANQSFPKGTNAVTFHPTPNLRSDSVEVEQRTNEAIDLLERCVRENPNTPWEYLARQELAHGLGLRANPRQLSRIPTTPGRAPVKRALPKF